MSEAAFVALGAVAVGLLQFATARWARPKVRAEAANQAVEAMRTALETVREELKEERHARLALEERVEILETDGKKKDRGIAILKGQLAQAGIEPQWP